MSGFSLAQGAIVNNLVAYSPTQAQDVIAVFDNDFNQLFPDARALTADVSETAKLMKHPVETGIVITDHRIIEPIKITLNVIMRPDTFADMYQQAKDVFKGNTTIQVQTKTDLYSSMLMQELPHKEDAAHFDTITMVMKFEQVLFVKAQTLKLSSVNAGNKTGKTASATDSEHAKETTQKSSAAYSLIFGK